MWRDLISKHCPTARFSPPASDAALHAAEAALQIVLDEQLRDCLRESNGVFGEYSLALLWPLQRIVADNIAFRANRDFKQLYMPFDCLLFFADAGNGDQFAFPIQDGEIRRHDVFVWNHEEDSRSWAAPSLQRYFEWWLTGKLTI